MQPIPTGNEAHALGRVKIVRRPPQSAAADHGAGRMVNRREKFSRSGAQYAPLSQYGLVSAPRRPNYPAGRYFTSESCASIDVVWYDACNLVCSARISLATWSLETDSV